MNIIPLSFRLAPWLLALGLVLFSSTILLQSCQAPDPAGLQNVTNLSTRLTTLMSKGTEPFSKHSDEIKSVMSELSAAESHATGQKRNKIIASQWTTLRTGLIEPFLQRWKEGKLDKDFVKESVAQVQNSLEAIRKAEKNK